MSHVYEEPTRKAKKANYVGGRPKDETKLSDNPAQVRNRLRRAMKGTYPDGRVKRDIEILYRKPLEKWDLEELAHGRVRGADGTFVGRAPSWITPVMQAEAKRRLLTATFGKMAKHIDTAVQVVANLMTSEEIDDKGRPIVDARTKLAAAAFVLEHFLGKPTVFVEAEINDMTKSAIASAIVLDDGEPEDHFILEGSFEELEDMEENEDNDDA